MSKKIGGWVAGLAVPLFLLHSAAVRAETTEIPVVRLEARIEVTAPPHQVWAYMTTGKNLVTWCPYWKSPGNAEVRIAEVGDVLEYLDSWGNGGRSIVTYLDRNKELRLAHEPTDGSYLCQAKLRLQPNGGGTAVEYVEQYTDESEPSARRATAKRMREEIEETLAAIKSGAEAK